MKKKLNHLPILLLVLFVSSRSIVPPVIYESYIWILAVIYCLKGDWRGIEGKLKYKKWGFNYFLCFIMFSISLLVSSEVVGFKVFYNFIQFIPFLIIFSKTNRIKKFVIYSAFYLSVLSILMLVHRIGIASFEQLFYIRGFQRAQGLMGNPNYFAYFCFCIFVLLNYTVKGKKLFILSFLMLVCIVLSLSRGVLIGVFLFLIIKILTSMKRIILTSVLLLVVFFNISTITNGAVSADLFDRVIELEQGGSGRSNIWKQGYEIWSSDYQDVILGFGFNQFQNKVCGLGINNTVHNSYLRILYEFGILGFFVLFSFYISVLSSIKWKNFKAFIGFLVPLSVCWATNDFFILKETFFLMSILLIIQKVE